MAPIPGRLSLLVHITYHDSNTTNPGSSQALKLSKGWRDFCFDAIVQQFEEMERGYVAFRRVDVVVDANEGHGYVERLRRWPESRWPTASRVSVRVDVHQRSTLTHPFRLAWMHRAQMESKLDAYDWFMSIEGDTFVPARAMATQVALAPMLFEKHQILLGFVRLCNDTEGRSFYSDITKPVARSSVVRLPGIEGHSFIVPQNSYAAVWAYPQAAMRGFVQSIDWPEGTRRLVRGMRERAAWGWRHGKIMTLADSPALRIYHLGKSGPYLVRVRGHNTLPADSMVVGTI